MVDKYDKKLVKIISITYEPEEKLLEFFKKHELSTKIVVDDDFKTFKSAIAWGIPMKIFINNERKVVSVIHPNYFNDEVMESFIKGNMLEVKQHDGWGDSAGAEKHFRSTLKRK